ncbi:MAG: Co2+/Mg2+ efflux protein ApaG [Alphaproteobacteria bacterium]
MYRATTRAITVEVQPMYLEDQSSPDEEHFVWAYRIQILNEGPETVQLLRRHWKITDANGQVIEVEGEGVVGEQPVLEPGSAFEYTSGTPLTTPYGIMAGEYQMETAAGVPFEVEIPAFSLSSPYAKRVLN